jgi:serine/threonine protein kinase
MMDHPNIARVLDAGATESGRPFFVMELVRGEKITDFCDQYSLPMRSGSACSCWSARPSSTPTRKA